MTYECPVCGVKDETAYMRCYRAGCTDGRDGFGRTRPANYPRPLASDGRDHSDDPPYDPPRQFPNEPLLGRPAEPPCSRPPEGWFCTREKDHTGPCAAWPNVEDSLAAYLNPTRKRGWNLYWPVAITGCLLAMYFGHKLALLMIYLDSK